MIDAFALSQPGEDIRLFILPILRDQEAGHCLPDRFFGRIAEQAFRALVPAGDDAVRGPC